MVAGGGKQNYVKEYTLDSMKISDVMSMKEGFNIKFTSDGKRTFIFGLRDCY
jgi:hypothetical protein